MSAQLEPREYTRKIHEADATDEQRQLYADVCEALAFAPETPEPIDSRYQVTLSCRCQVEDRADAKRLATRLGLTRNALILSATQMGMAAIQDAIDQLDPASD